MHTGGTLASTKHARRRGRPKAVDATDTKRCIIETALRLFYRHGVGLVSVDTIIAEAHVSKAGLYYHFSSKEQLVAEVLRLQSRLVLETLQERLSANPSSGLQNLIDAVAHYMSNPERRGDLFVNTIAEGFPSQICRNICLEHQRHLISCIREFAMPSLSQAAASQVLLVVYGMIVRDQIDANVDVIEHGRTLLHKLAQHPDA